MRKFKVLASYVNVCEVEIDAEDEDQAWEIARDMDGGSFTPCGGADWQIDEVIDIGEGDQTEDDDNE